MTKGFPFRAKSLIRVRGLWLCVIVALAFLGGLSLQAEATAGTHAADSEDFGQYLVDHQHDLSPFFTKNLGELITLAVPLFMSMLGGVIIFTMLLGWGLDVLMSRGYAYFFAPAYGDWKRCIVYATGRLFLSFLYSCLICLALVLCMGLSHALAIICIAVLVLMIVGFAAQIVWILYLYRTSFTNSILFYIVLGLVHVAAGFILMKPMMGSHAPSIATNFIDRAIVPRLQADADATNLEFVKAKAARDVIKAKVSDLQEKTATSGAEQDRLRRQIEEKKNSDIYSLAQIVKVRAAGDLATAHEQLAAFPGRFPNSPLNALAHSQLNQLNEQMASELALKKQHDVDVAKAEAAARTALLARAAKGQATLSEMRLALLGKTRSQVSEILGKPTETASDTWGYTQQMILNPLTNERHGLLVYFNVGIVQGVDYNRNRGTP